MSFIVPLSHRVTEWHRQLPYNFDSTLLPGADVYSATGPFGSVCVQRYSASDFNFTIYSFRLSQTFIFELASDEMSIHTLIMLEGQSKLQPNPNHFFQLEKNHLTMAMNTGKPLTLSQLQKHATLFHLSCSAQLLAEMQTGFSAVLSKLYSSSSSPTSLPAPADIITMASSIFHCGYAPEIRNQFFHMRSRDLLFHSLLLLQGVSTDALASISENDRKLIEQAEQLINADLSHHLPIKDLAQRLAISPPTFKRLFKVVKGMPPFEYLVMQRMKLALALLQSGSSVKEAAALTGYQSPSFTRVFTKYYGRPPSAV